MKTTPELMVKAQKQARNKIKVSFSQIQRDGKKYGNEQDGSSDNSQTWCKNF